jgi:hypothetical protein
MAASGFYNPCPLGAFFIGVPFHPKDMIFLLPTKKSEAHHMHFQRVSQAPGISP